MRRHSSVSTGADTSNAVEFFWHLTTMTKVKVAAFSISLDGFGAGPRQDINNPLGVRGLELHKSSSHLRNFKSLVIPSRA
jgi:hypothetical protein